MPMSQEDVIVEMNRCFNSQCLVRQRARELVWEVAPLAWRRVEGRKAATTSCEPLIEDLYENKRTVHKHTPLVVLAV